MEAAPLASRVFTALDQENFAAFSGDRNPMHMDAVAARRTQAGSCVVHGVHAFLWALDRLAGGGVPVGTLASAKVDFVRFIRLERTVSLTLRTRSERRLTAELAQDGRRVVGIDLGFGDSPMPPAGPPMPGAALSPAAPAEPPLADLSHASGSLGAPAGTAAIAAEMFPDAVAALGAGRTVSIGLISTLVGMVVPGLHSILSAIRIGFDTPERADGLRYRVGGLDERFRMVNIDLAGSGVAGSVTAYARFPPVRPPQLRDLEGRVAPGEFAGRRALIIGGSRGLGACVAMLIAAGGGSVILTYRQGQSEAEALRAAIGADRCRIAHYDTEEPPDSQPFPGPDPVTHVYYFATGPIFDRAHPIFAAAAFERFFQVYVVAFLRLIEHLLNAAPDTPLHAFYPSSVAVENRPKGMTEYAMAKAAGEILCTDLARLHRNLSVSAPRLPRIMTDQTATVPPVPAADPVEVLLPLVRAERGAG